jgi:hypothetical protein
MITSMVSRTRIYRAGLWDFFLSALRCFVLRHCFRLVAKGRDGSETNASVRTPGTACNPVAGMGPALILLAFAATDPPALMRALRR